VGGDQCIARQREGDEIVMFFFLFESDVILGAYFDAQGVRGQKSTLFDRHGDRAGRETNTLQTQRQRTLIANEEQVSIGIRHTYI
jgi:hypothetical protein